jgi:hypothetical protein
VPNRENIDVLGLKTVFQKGLLTIIKAAPSNPTIILALAGPLARIPIKIGIMMPLVAVVSVFRCLALEGWGNNRLARGLKPHIPP